MSIFLVYTDTWAAWSQRTDENYAKAGLLILLKPQLFDRNCDFSLKKKSYRHTSDSAIFPVGKSGQKRGDKVRNTFLYCFCFIVVKIMIRKSPSSI